MMMIYTIINNRNNDKNIEKIIIMIIITWA